MSFLRVMFATLIFCAIATAQTVSPVIVEYKGAGAGKIALTNNTQTPLAVTLQPQSFGITPEGKGKYVSLDPHIHVKLSATSARLMPGQTYYVFYKAKADKYPAWFTIFSEFSAPRHENGIDVRIVLPHTVYLYQKERIQKSDIQIKSASYDLDKHTINCEIQNVSDRLARAQSASATGPHSSTEAGGFPLLPGGTRHLELDWKANHSPKEFELTFEHFRLTSPITTNPAAAQ